MESAQGSSGFPLGTGLPNLSTSPLETDPESTSTEADDDANVTSNDIDASASSKESIALTTDYRFENGRRYHDPRTGDYHLPNDATEQTRLELQHRVFQLALDGHSIFAPIPKDRIRRVLDIGCGTGIWCIEVAKQLPHAQIDGIDLSPIQPKNAPSNCTFYIEDLNAADWTHNRKYDLVHMSAMILAVDDYPKLYRQVFQALNPGGWLQIRDYHGNVSCRNEPGPPKPYMCQFTDLASQALATMGRNTEIADQFGTLLEGAGFVDVRVVQQDIPLGTWVEGAKYKEMGRLMAENMINVVWNSGAIFTRLLAWSLEDFQSFAAATAEDTKSGRWHMYAKASFVCGMKPEMNE